MNITSPIKIAPRPINTQAHAGSPLLLAASGLVVEVGVSWTVVVRLLIDVVLPAPCSVFVSVTVSVLAGSVIVLASVRVVAPLSLAEVVLVVVAAVTEPVGPEAATSQASAAPPSSATVRRPSVSALADPIA